MTFKDLINVLPLTVKVNVYVYHAADNGELTFVEHIPHGLTVESLDWDALYVLRVLPESHYMIDVMVTD